MKVPFSQKMRDLPALVSNLHQSVIIANQDLSMRYLLGEFLGDVDGVIEDAKSIDNTDDDSIFALQAQLGLALRSFYAQVLDQRTMNDGIEAAFKEIGQHMGIKWGIINGTAPEPDVDFIPDSDQTLDQEEATDPDELDQIQ
jgi:hypothetical protein